jgi:Ca2+-binding RTX toxin-like protein
LGNDTLNGGDDADAIYGEAGDDILNGGTTFSTDILVGGDGNDTLNGVSGQANPDYDLMDGGAGNDSYFVDTGADLTFEAVGGGIDTVYANIPVVGAGVYLYANVENLVLQGTTSFGVGNELANSLIGNAASNYLLGGAGDDIINGKGGNDVLFGELGADTFVFERGTGGDVIGDFVHGTDRIDLRGLGFSFAQLQSAFSQVGTNGAINLGSGDFIVLHNVTMSTLTASDFIF